MNSFVTGRCKRVTAILCICFLLIQSLGCGKSVVAKRSIVAENLKGTVSAERDRASRNIVKGEKLQSGDSVTVMFDSDLTLLLDSDKHVFAGSATYFTLEAVDGGTKFRLLEGTLTVNIENKLGDGEDFEVHTNNAVMAVRGTVFTVTVTRENEVYTTELSVSEGIVEVRTIEDGKEVTYMINPGESGTYEGSAPGSGYVPPKKASVDPTAYKTLDLSGYEDFGFAYGGVIPVYDGDFWGAIDYEGNVIIPLQYDEFNNPNNKGYTVFKSSTPEGYVSYLYDNKGTLITSCDGYMVANSDVYVTARWENYGKDEPEKDLWMDSCSMTHSYYNYDGSLLTNVESGYAERYFANPKGFYDGKSVVTGNIKTSVYRRSDIHSGVNPFDFGFIDTKGNIEWKDGDGYDDTDASQYMDFASGQAAQEAERQQQLADLEKWRQEHPNSGGAAAGGVDAFNEVDAVISTLNHGYFLTNAQFEEGVFLRDENGKTVAWFEPWYMTFGYDGTNYYLDYTADQRSRMGYDELLWEYSGNDYDPYIDYYGFWHDGEWIYNYGSKMVIRNQDKAALIDLAVTGGQLKYKVFDYCALADEKYWLIKQDGQWGYCDHEGNVVQMYDDAGAFVNGIAPVVHDGEAYIVNEDFEDLKSLGTATGVASNGEMIVIYNGSEKTVYLPE